MVKHGFCVPDASLEVSAVAHRFGDASHGQPEDRAVIMRAC
jgi:hypothetical protein